MQIMNSKCQGRITYSISYAGRHTEMEVEAFRIFITDFQEEETEMFAMELLYDMDESNIFAFRHVSSEELLEMMDECACDCEGCGINGLNFDVICDNEDKASLYFGMLDQELKSCAEFILKMR